jgi:hypothetical protein
LKSTRRLAAILVTLLIPALGVVVVTKVQAYTCSTVPIGQANPSAEPEPMQPIWCASGLAAEPTIRTLDSFGGWTDSFQTNVQMGQLNDGQMGYRVFDSMTNGGAIDPTQVRSQHFVNNNHWMVDMSHNNGGAVLSPNQAFHFENGKLVLEADVAAGIPGYFDSFGDIVWPEIVWSTAPAPTGKVVDNLYTYGQFGGAWASGCRLNAERDMICSLESPTALASTNNDTYPCFSFAPDRVMEISAFEQCGSTHYGGAVSFGAPATAWRACQANQMDMFCRDRFRLEWTQSGFTAYVNGILFFQDSGWPGYAQIPTSIVNGSTPIYAYFGEWGDFSDSNVYRFHWGRLAVNPHDSSGNLLGPSASPSYCPAMPDLTCSMTAMLNTCAAVSVGAAPQSPQISGTQVTFTAAATGCPSPRYEFWMRSSAGSWHIVQPFSSTPIFSWSTSSALADTYYIGVWAKNADSPTSTFEQATSAAYSITTTLCNSVTLTPAPGSPQVAGTPVVFSAAASGCPSPRYEFWMRSSSGPWQLVQAYSGSATFSWSTSGLFADTYYFGVWAKDAASPTSTFDINAAATYKLNPASCAAVSVSAAPPTAAHSNLTQVTFTATASGCTHAGPLYEFWYFNGSAWFVVRGWSTSPTWVWNTSAPAGNYTFGVWVRDAASPGIHDGGSMGRFDIAAGFTYNLT